MSSEESAPAHRGAQPQRTSTSIDDVLGQQSAEPYVAPVSHAPAQPSPAPSGDVAAQEAQPRGKWHTAAEVKQRNPRKRSLSGDAPMWFGFGLALLLWGGILLVDHYGPTTERNATITDLDVTRSRKGGTTHSIEGVDELGGTFDTDVPESIYDRADRGESVVISRAWLTNRVVTIDGGGWRHDGGRMVWLHGIAVGIGVVLLVVCIRSMRRFAAEDPESPRPLRRVRWALIVVPLAAAGWILYERNEASAGDSGRSSSPAAAVTLPAAPGSLQCTDLTVTMALMMPALTSRGMVSGMQIDQTVDVIEMSRSECSRDSIQRALCVALRQAASADPTLTVLTGGRCPGILP